MIDREHRWLTAHFQVDGPAVAPPAVLEILLDALAWIDWFGVTCEEKVIQRPDFVFRTVAPSMSQMIQCAKGIIADGNSVHGEQYWVGEAA